MGNVITEVIKDIAKRVFNAIKGAIENSPTGVSFVSIKGYVNSKGEESNVVINIGVSYADKKKKDIKALKKVNVLEHDELIDKVFAELCRVELIDSMENPRTMKYPYTHINEALKVHNDSGKVFIWGMVHTKEIIKDGVYPEKRVPTTEKAILSAKKVKMKNILKKLFVFTSNYRMYTMTEIDTMKLNGETIEF
jgi:hypothetical protein